MHRKQAVAAGNDPVPGRGLMALRSPLRGWPVWQLPRWLAACVTAVIAAYAAAVAGALASDAGAARRPAAVRRVRRLRRGFGGADAPGRGAGGPGTGRVRHLGPVGRGAAAAAVRAGDPPPARGAHRVAHPPHPAAPQGLQHRGSGPVLRGGLAGLQVRRARPVRRRGIGRPCPGLDHARCRVRAGEHGRPGLPDPAPGQGHRGSRHPAAQPGPRPGGGLQPGHRAVPGSADRVRSRAQRPRPGCGVAPGDRAAAIAAPRLTWPPRPGPTPRPGC